MICIIMKSEIVNENQKWKQQRGKNKNKNRSNSFKDVTTAVWCANIREYEYTIKWKIWRKKKLWKNY